MNNNDDYIYLIDKYNDDYLKEKRLKIIFEKIINEEVKIEDLSINDMFNLSDYLLKTNNKLEQEINLKKINLLLLNHELSELSY